MYSLAEQQTDIGGIPLALNLLLSLDLTVDPLRNFRLRLLANFDGNLPVSESDYQGITPFRITDCLRLYPCVPLVYSVYIMLAVII